MYTRFKQELTVNKKEDKNELKRRQKSPNKKNLDKKILIDKCSNILLQAENSCLI